MFLLGSDSEIFRSPTELIPRRVLGSVSAFILVPLGTRRAGARIHMAKTKLSRAKMCKKILAAIQEYPGCKDVKEVSVAEVADTAAKSIWRVTVVDSGVLKSKRPTTLRGMFNKSFGNNMNCNRAIK